MTKTTIMLKADTKQRAASKRPTPPTPTAEELQERYEAACEAVRDAIHAMAKLKGAARESLDNAILDQLGQLDTIVSDLVCMGPEYS